jgi:hypothetical protein
LCCAKTRQDGRNGKHYRTWSVSPVTMPIGTSP